MTSDTSCLELSKTSQVKGIVLRKAALTSGNSSQLRTPRLPTWLTNWLQIQWSRYPFLFDNSLRRTHRTQASHYDYSLLQQKTNKQIESNQKKRGQGLGRSPMQNFCVLSLHSPDILTAQHTAGNNAHRMSLTRDVHSSFLVLGFY